MGEYGSGPESPKKGSFFGLFCLEDGETVHNVFFDRSFKESRK